MIDIQEFVTKIQAVLNGTDSLVSSLSRPDTSTYFDVRSPELPFADSVASLENKQTRFPVMVEQNSAGRYEAFPNVNMWSMSLTMTFLFPVANTLAVRNYFEYLASAVNGQQINFGASSGYCVCALGVPTMGQMQYLDMNQYSQVKESVNVIFGKTVNLSREWSTMTCEFYLSGSLNAGQAEGLIFGNQIEHTVSFSYQGVTYSETLVPVARSVASSAMAYEQQGLSSSLQKGIAQSGAQVATLTCMVRANDFWLKVLALKDLGYLKDTAMTLYEIWRVGGNVWFGTSGFTKCFIKDIGLTEDLGKPVSAILTIEPQLTVGSI